MSDNFNPRSMDACIAEILANQRNMSETLRVNNENVNIQIRELREETRAGFERVGSRVGSLERFRDTLKGKLAVASAAISLLVATIAEWLKAKMGSA